MDRTGSTTMFDKLTIFYKFIGGASAVALLLILVANIAARELFTYSLPWANEAALVLFVWMTFIGAGICFAQDARIRFTMGADALPPRVRHVLEVAVTWVGAALLLGLLATSIYSTWLYRNQVFATMPLSMSWQWASVPAGMALALLGWIRHGTWWSRRPDALRPTDDNSNIAI